MLASAQDWASSFAKDVWQHPKDHPLAIAGAVLAIGAAVAIGKGTALKMCEEGAAASEGIISHVPTIGAKVRPWVETDLAACVAPYLKPGGVVVGLGAGSITVWIHGLQKKLEGLS